MKEVKSRDPARRMVLRYDKLYVGNDVFFFNDRSGRVERLHQPLEAGIPASTSLGNLILNESQVNKVVEPHFFDFRESRWKVKELSANFDQIVFSSTVSWLV